MCEQEIKPCPYCGSTDIKLHDEITHAVWCQECFSEVESIDIESAIKLWNTRPIEDALQARIAELEAQQRWIPVSERLPDNWESVLTIDISKSTRDMVTAFYNPETSLWSTHFSCDLWVTHWMPLPEPPIVYGKVCEE